MRATYLPCIAICGEGGIAVRSGRADEQIEDRESRWEEGTGGGGGGEWVVAAF